jgi:hypothetical protein
MITHDIARNFRMDFEAAMKPLEEKYSFKIHMGNISFTEAKLHAGLEATLLVNGEEAPDPIEEAKAQNFLLRMNHKPVEKIIGSEIILQNNRHGVITGFSNRRKNEPFEARIDGKDYYVALGQIKKFITDKKEGKK